VNTKKPGGIVLTISVISLLSFIRVTILPQGDKFPLWYILEVFNRI
jgi:hypothetical protein